MERERERERHTHIRVMTTPAEIVQLLAAAIQPILADMNRQSDERFQRVATEAKQRIQALEAEIANLRDNRVQPPNRGHRNLMEHKAFTKIANFKDGPGKWRTFRTQVENLVETALPGQGRKVLRWARGLGGQSLELLEGTHEYNVNPQAPLTHEIAQLISSELAITLSYLLEGEAESILSISGEGHGIEAWQRLQGRFDPRSNARDLVETQKTIRPPQCNSLSEVLPALERWEESLRHMNDRNRPSELIKMGIVIGVCPGKLQDHVQDLDDRIQPYAQLRSELIRKIDL